MAEEVLTNVSNLPPERSREPDAAVNELSGAALDAALEVHRALGPGFAESVYEQALAVELGLRGLRFQRQVPTVLKYKNYVVGEGRIDLIIDGRVLLELKAVETLLPVHFAQILSYLRATQCRVGLLINFNAAQLRTGVRRVVLSF